MKRVLAGVTLAAALTATAPGVAQDDTQQDKAEGYAACAAGYNTLAELEKTTGAFHNVQPEITEAAVANLRSVSKTFLDAALAINPGMKDQIASNMAAQLEILNGGRMEAHAEMMSRISAQTAGCTGLLKAPL